MCVQVNNVLIFVLAAAAIVEGALQSWAEFGLVLGVIAINTGKGVGYTASAPTIRVCDPVGRYL